MERIEDFLGYQVADCTGDNIQGEPGDPSGLSRNEIMSRETADKFIENNPGFTLFPMYKGMIAKYKIV